MRWDEQDAIWLAKEDNVRQRKDQHCDGNLGVSWEIWQSQVWPEGNCINSFQINITSSRGSGELVKHHKGGKLTQTNSTRTNIATTSTVVHSLWSLAHNSNVLCESSNSSPHSPTVHIATRGLPTSKSTKYPPRHPCNPKSLLPAWLSADGYCWTGQTWR